MVLGRECKWEEERESRRGGGERMGLISGLWSCEVCGGGGGGGGVRLLLLALQMRRGDRIDVVVLQGREVAHADGVVRGGLVFVTGGR
jgi:hypothetical protein